MIRTNNIDFFCLCEQLKLECEYSQKAVDSETDYLIIEGSDVQKIADFSQTTTAKMVFNMFKK